MTLPAALNVANSSLIWSEVQYAYTPTIGYVISGTLTLKDQIYMRPRLSDTRRRATSDRDCRSCSSRRSAAPSST